ncbi:MFS transporter [Halobacterium litoreum]|uniref:MFS transporter n=1 Tax=Halobacterium litoreum TaxID=2039234 RepID=A0ABD5NF99_9EURY|nr:MFS transporter [Halobacterium litoreum]UHH13523.1 MFS transporter [Halobacterium litoreum]
MDDASRRRALFAVLAVVFVDLVGFGVVIPVLPFYTRFFGGDELVIGLLAASYSLMQFVGAPVLGTLSDRRGRRPVILVSVAGSALAWTVFGFATGLAWLFASRLLAGAMGGNVAAAQAYVADITPEDDRTRALGLVGAAFGLGFIVGPSLGAVLSFDPVVAAVARLAPDWLPISRFSLPAFGAAVLALANLALAYRYLPETRRVATAGVAETTPLADLRAAASAPALRGLLVAFFALSFAFSGVQIMFIPFVADVYDYGTTQSALLLAYIGVLSVLVQGVFVGRFTDRVGEARATVFGVSVLVAAVAALPVAPELGRALLPFVTAGALGPELAALLAVLVALALGNGVLNVTLVALVSRRASADLQGSAFGVTQSAGSLARTVGPVVMGGAYATVGYWAPFALGALTLLPVVAITRRLARDDADYRLTDPGHVR